MTTANFGILQPVDVGGMFNQGLEQGRQQRIERETDNALRAYAQNPNDPNAVNALLRYNPRLGMQLQQQQREQQQRQQSQVQTGQALGGDMQSFRQLAQTDPEQWNRIRPEVERATRTVGQAAMWADDPQKWDQMVAQLSADYPDLAQYRGRFSPELRARFIAEAGQMTQFMEQQQPRVQSVAPGGAIVAMDRDGTNQGYVVAPPGMTDAPAYIPPAQRQPAMAGAPQAAPLTETEAGPIMQAAMQTKVMSQADADRFIAALGPNGQQQFQHRYRCLQGRRPGIPVQPGQGQRPAQPVAEPEGGR